MEKISQKQNIFFQYLVWQFKDVPIDILKAWKNFLLFYSNYFSIPILLRTFFSHWRRYYYSYGKRWDIKRYFEAFTFNMMSRIIGAIVRTIFIILGLLVEIFIILGGILIFFGWLVLPAILIFGLIFGFRFLI